MHKLFKPMLAGKLTNPENLHYPLLASVKLDGIRATVQNGQLLSRTLKPIPNKAIQQTFAGLPQGLDGELILGDPTAPDAFRKTSSRVMSPDETSEDIVFHIFDVFDIAGFQERYNTLKALQFMHSKHYAIKLVEHHLIHSRKELELFEHRALGAGYEGVMIRSLQGAYKQGRSTEREGSLLKMKQFEDGEAEIIGFEELQHNDNEALTNELGRTHRQTLQSGMRPANTLGALQVRDLQTGVEFAIGTGFEAQLRYTLWVSRNQILGQIVKYKYFPTGSKDKPRFPVFVGIRDRIDL